MIRIIIILLEVTQGPLGLPDPNLKTPVRKKRLYHCVLFDFMGDDC